MNLTVKVQGYRKEWQREDNMKRYILSIGLLIVALVVVTGCMTGGYKDISAQEAKDLIDQNPNIVIIDVSPFYSQGHLPGAVSYPIGNGTLEDAIPSLDKDAKYLVYCHSDSVAIQAANLLVDAGFTDVYRLDGNYSAWIDAGYPVEQ
jgi:rhodanese-related sulfurtransferase